MVKSEKKMKKSKNKGEMKKSKKKEKGEKNNAALEMLLPNKEEDDESGWTKVGAGGIVPGDEDDVLAENDIEEEENEVANRKFLSQMAKSEKGEAR